MMKMYNEAYGVLSDPKSKSKYDLLLRNHRYYEEHAADEHPANVYQTGHTNEYQSSQADEISDAWWNRAAYGYYSEFSFKKILGIFFILIGSFLLLDYFMLINPYWLNTTEGRIINSRVGIPPNVFGSFNAKVDYEYTVNGITYSDSEELCCYTTENALREELNHYLNATKDDPMIITYDSNDPKRSVIRSGSGDGSFSRHVLSYGVILAGFGLICFFDLIDIARFLYIVKYIKKKLQRDNNQDDE